MSEVVRQPKNLGTLGLLSVMIMCTSMIFTVAGDAPQTFALTVLGLAGSFALRNPLPRSTRSFIYAGIIALIVTVLSDMIFPIPPDRFFLVPAQIYCPAVIFLAIAATYFDQRDTNLTAVVALTLVAAMLAGNTIAGFTYKPRLAFINRLLVHFHLFYGTMITIQLLAMLAVLPRIDRRILTAGERPLRRSRRTVLLITSIVLVAGGTLFLRKAAFYYESLMRKTFSEIFQKYMRRRSRSVVFGNDVNLWRTVPLLRAQDETIVLRVISEASPGYLRGRVFTHYRDGRWTNPRYGEALPFTEPGGRYAFKLFERHRDAPLQPGAPPPAEVTVYPATYLHDALLYAPGSARRFELIADGLANNPDGILVPREWDQQAGYSMLVPTDQSTSYPRPTFTDRLPPKHYTLLPEAGRDAFADVAHDVFSGDGPAASTIETVGRLIGYFRRGFTYSLGVKIDSREDPVLQFLTEHRKGHCELFASATVLLLRQQGIAARYVTGFICEEQHPAGSHWLARLKHAHAWAEAYIPETESWVLVESTPATGIPNGVQRAGFLAAVKDAIQLWWMHLLAKLKRGYIAEVVLQSLIAVGRLVWFCVASPLRGSLFLILALLALRRYTRRRQQHAPDDILLPPEKRRLQNILAGLQQHIRRVLDCERPPETTLREWAQQIAASATPQSQTIIHELFSEYEQLRYRQAPPKDSVVDEFGSKARRQIKSIRPQPQDTEREGMNP